MREYNIGDKIKFRSEAQRYTVVAKNERYLICIKPFNLKKTFLYTIIDLTERIRGSDNYYCKFNYQDVEDSNQAIEELVRGDLEISHRTRIPLDIQL